MNKYDKMMESRERNVVEEIGKNRESIVHFIARR